MSETEPQSEWTAAEIIRRFPSLAITVDTENTVDTEYIYSSAWAIMIKDADTLNQFLTNARAAWVAKHETARRRGRPSERAKVFRMLWDAKSSGHAGNRSSQGKLIRLVGERLGSDALSKDAIRKYVKMWTILHRNNRTIPDLSLPPADLRWFEKHAAKTMKVIKEYEAEVKDLKPDVRANPVSDTLITGGLVGNESLLEMIIGFPPGLTPAIYQKWNQLRRELVDFLPPKASR